MAKTNYELVQWCQSKIGTPYVYGARGSVVTSEQIDKWAKQYPAIYVNEDYIKKSKAHAGKVCADCSGLISWFTGQSKSSGMFKNTADAVLQIEQLDESMIGWGLWKSGHIGVYIGNGKCISARNVNLGTMEYQVAGAGYTHVLKLCDITYKSSGWVQEHNGWRFYLGDTGRYIENDWYQDDGDWYWFDGAGMMLHDNWYYYQGNWYYFNDNGKMAKNQWVCKGQELYWIKEDGRMFSGQMSVQADGDGAYFITASEAKDYVQYDHQKIYYWPLKKFNTASFKVVSGYSIKGLEDE